MTKHQIRVDLQDKSVREIHSEAHGYEQTSTPHRQVEKVAANAIPELKNVKRERKRTEQRGSEGFSRWGDTVTG